MVKTLPANAGDIRDVDLMAGLESSPGGGNGNPFQYSRLRNPMDRGAGQATVHGVVRVGRNLATKPPQRFFLAFCLKKNIAKIPKLML